MLHEARDFMKLQTTVGHPPLIVMSESAHRGFTPEQRERLEQHGKLVPVHITTIEAVGGGSAGCMPAEVFLPQIAQQMQA
ncbi:MAG: arginine deiminase-related protein [Acidobacteriota bacterium]|nr:arginine deiminase-related protein [Acidobacteriota bacterium]